MKKPSKALTVLSSSAHSTQLSTLLELQKKVGEAASASLSENSKRAYLQGWEDFRLWCLKRGFPCDLKKAPISADHVTLFLVDRADHVAVATLELRLSAISYMHKISGYEDPPTKSARVLRTLQGIKRQKGVDQDRKLPLQAEHLRKIIPGLCRIDPDRCVRDKAILLFGFATGMRRSELAALQVGDLKFEQQGVLVKLAGRGASGELRRSKTDQFGVGRWLGVHYGKQEATCPVLALKAWLEEKGAPSTSWSSIAKKTRLGVGKLSPEMSLFDVGVQTIARVVKNAVKSIGLDAKLYSGHSMRAGLVTEAEERGIDRRVTRMQTGHKTDAMLERYARPQDAFRRNVTEDIGL